MCALMSVRREGACFRPYFQNRVGEIRSNLTELAELVDVLEEPQKIPGTLNPADVCTRGLAVPEDVNENSVWINGPDFLKEPRDQWPLSIPNDLTAVPRSELRARPENVQVAEDLQGESLVQRLGQPIAGAGRLVVLVGSVARALIAMGSANSDRAPEPEDRRAAFKLLLHCQQASARAAWTAGKLDSLAVGLARGARAEH